MRRKSDSSLPNRPLHKAWALIRQVTSRRGRDELGRPNGLTSYKKSISEGTVFGINSNTGEKGAGEAAWKNN